MKTVLTFLLALAGLALSGCAGVYVLQPVGDKPHVLTTADWEGTWFGGDEACTVRVVDAAAGQLQVVSAKFKEGKPTLDVTDLLVRESNEWLIFNLRDENGGAPRYEWALGKRADEQLLVWLPDCDKFRALVSAGKLKGRIEDKDVVLDALPAQELKMLTSGEVGVPFGWYEPSVFRRLAR